MEWFKEIKDKSIETESWDSAIFYFCIIIIVDFLPFSLFISNLEFLWMKNNVVVSKRLHNYSDSGSSNNSERIYRGKCFDGECLYEDRTYFANLTINLEPTPRPRWMRMNSETRTTSPWTHSQPGQTNLLTL